jgi:hypothetical protein
MVSLPGLCKGTQLYIVVYVTHDGGSLWRLRQKAPRCKAWEGMRAVSLWHTSAHQLMKCPRTTILASEDCIDSTGTWLRCWFCVIDAIIDVFVLFSQSLFAPAIWMQKGYIVNQTNILAVRTVLILQVHDWGVDFVSLMRFSMFLSCSHSHFFAQVIWMQKGYIVNQQLASVNNLQYNCLGGRLLWDSEAYGKWPISCANGAFCFH